MSTAQRLRTVARKGDGTSGRFSPIGGRFLRQKAADTGAGRAVAFDFSF
jgi:hypothetical protein